MQLCTVLFSLCHEKISKILNKHPISITSKNLLFISYVKFFLLLCEIKARYRTYKSRQTEARNIRDIQPIMPPNFFLFFLYTSLEKRRVEKNGENF